MQPSVIQFCKAREALRDESKIFSAERAEVSENRRALGSMLQESMAGNDLHCLEIPGTVHGTYVTMVTPKPRARSLKTEQDMEHLLQGVGTCIRGVVIADIPEKVTRYLVERMRTPVTSIAMKPRLTVKQRPPSKTENIPMVNINAASGEVQRLVEQYIETYNHSKVLRQTMKPFREAQRKTEQEALGEMHEPMSLRMQKHNKDVVDLRVVRCERETRSKQNIGVRMVMSWSREEASRLAHLSPDDFEHQFQENLLSRVRAHIDKAAPRHYLKVYRVQKPNCSNSS